MRHYGPPLFTRKLHHYGASATVCVVCMDIQVNGVNKLTSSKFDACLGTWQYINLSHCNFASEIGK